MLLEVMAKDFKLDNITHELKLAEKEELYEKGFKPSMLAAAMIVKYHPETKKDVIHTGNVTWKRLKRDVEYLDELERMCIIW